MYNFDTIKNIIQSQQGWECEIHVEHGHLTAQIYCLENGLDVFLSIVEREKSVQSDIQVNYDEETIVEGTYAFSKNDQDLENTIFNWIKTQIQFAINDLNETNKKD